MNTEQQRKEFEEWAKTNTSINLDLDLDLDLDEWENCYWDISTYAVWEAWQAAQKTVTEQRDVAIQCHKWCYEDRKRIIEELDAARAELTAVTEQRDGLRSGIDYASDQLHKVTEQRDRLGAALQKLADCDWVISLPDRMDAVRTIAREAIAAVEGGDQ